jgi:hypothetical protein
MQQSQHAYYTLAQLARLCFADTEPEAINDALVCPYRASTLDSEKQALVNASNLAAIRNG